MDTIPPIAASSGYGTTSSPSHHFTLALAGNPNAGKTTLFNTLTGLRAKTANFPGTTVERKVGRMRLGERQVVLVDLPGLVQPGNRPRRRNKVAAQALQRPADGPWEGQRRAARGRCDQSRTESVPRQPGPGTSDSRDRGIEHDGRSRTPGPEDRSAQAAGRTRLPGGSDLRPSGRRHRSVAAGTRTSDGAQDPSSRFPPAFACARAARAASFRRAMPGPRISRRAA